MYFFAYVVDAVVLLWPLVGASQGLWGAMALAPAGAVAHRLLGTKDDCFAFSKLIHMSGWYQICVAWNLQEGIHLNGQSGEKGHTGHCVWQILMFLLNFLEEFKSIREKSRHSN